nr:PfkB family carbohydrate kinase [Lysobacter enzymogenes]
MTANTPRTVLVAGSANLDFVVRAAHAPAPGETVLGRELATYPGGKGANQALACAHAGAAPTRMLLALGEDAHAEPIERSLREGGVELHVRRCAERATGSAFVCVADDGENAIVVAPGANAAARRRPARARRHRLAVAATRIAARRGHRLGGGARGRRRRRAQRRARAALPPRCWTTSTC